jgi:hypothetical protein
MEKRIAATIEYLDPVSLNQEKKLFVPAVGELKGAKPILETHSEIA